MAMWSSDWFLPPLTPPNTLSKSLLSISIPHLLSFSPSYQRFIATNSSKSPPPLLATNDEAIILPGKDEAVILSNKAIQRLCSSPETSSLAFTYYQRAKDHPDFKLTQKTLDHLIVTLLSSQRWCSISSLSEDFTTFNVFPRAHIIAQLIRTCIESHKFKLAESLLGILANTNPTALPAFTAAMKAYNKIHMYSSTISAFDRMIAANVSPDSSCYFYAMDAHRKRGKTEMVLSLFLDFKSGNPPSSVFTARIYSVLCDSLGGSGRAFEALTYFREMLASGILPNRYLYASLINSFAEIKEADIAEELFKEAREKGMVSGTSVFMKLVSMHVQLGSVENTIVIVEMMNEMGVAPSDCILSAVINGFVKQRGLRAAVRAYTKLVALGCKVGQVSYASMINVYCSLGLTDEAEALFAEMMDKGFNKCVVAYSNMISMYGKARRANDAMRLLAKMKSLGCEPNIWIYNSLLDMNGRLVNLKEVKKLWSEMKSRGVKPDRVSYTSIVSAYCKAGEFEECMVFFREFKRSGGKVDRVLAGVMVGVFARSGRVDELLKMLKEMKAEGKEMDGRLYKSAANALRDAGLQAQLKWFEESFGLEKGKVLE